MFPGFPKKSRAQSPRDHLLRQHLKTSPYHAHPLGLRPALRAVLLRSEPFTLDLRAHILSYLLSMPRTQPPETEPNTPIMQAGRGQTGCLSRVAQQGRSGMQTQVPLQLTPHALWQALAASRSPTGLLGASQPRKTADTQQGCRSLGH